jgi:hypothetical protein
MNMAYGTQIVRIEMEIPADVDTSTVLELMQDAAVALSEIQDDDDEMSEAELEVVRSLVSVEIVPR